MDNLYKNIVKLKNDYETLKKVDNNYKIAHVGGDRWKENIYNLFDLFIYINQQAEYKYKKSNYSYYRVYDAFLELGSNNDFVTFLNSSAQNSTVIIDSLNFSTWSKAKDELPEFNVGNYRGIDNLISLAYYSINTLKNIANKKIIIKALWGSNEGQHISEEEKFDEFFKDYTKEKKENPIEPKENSILYQLRNYLYRNHQHEPITNNDRMLFTINFFQLLSIIIKGKTNFVIVHRSNSSNDSFTRKLNLYRNVYLLTLNKYSTLTYPIQIRRTFQEEINLDEIDDIACVILLYIISKRYGNKNVSILTQDNYDWSKDYPNINLYFQKLNVHGLLDSKKLSKLNFPNIIEFKFEYKYKSFHDMIMSNKTLINIDHTRSPDDRIKIDHSAAKGFRTQMFKFWRI